MRSVDYVLFRSIQRSRADYCLSVDCVQCSHHARSPTLGLQGPFEETPQPRVRGERSYSCSTAEPGHDGVLVGGAVTHSCNRLEGLSRCVGPCFPEVRLKEKGSLQGRGGGCSAGPGARRLCQPRRNSETSCPSSPAPGLSQRPLVRSHSDPGVLTAGHAGRWQRLPGRGRARGSAGAVQPGCTMGLGCIYLRPGGIRARLGLSQGNGGRGAPGRLCCWGWCWGSAQQHGALPKSECSFCSQQISGKYFIPKHWRTPCPTPPQIQVRALRCTGIHQKVGGAFPFGHQAYPVGAGMMETRGGTAPTGWGREMGPVGTGPGAGAASQHLMVAPPQGCARRPACSAVRTVTPRHCSGPARWGRASRCPPRR